MQRHTELEDMLACLLIQLFAVDGDRHALLEVHRDVFGLIRRFFGRDHRQQKVFRRLVPRSHYKELVASKFAELVYDGMWYTPLREALSAFVDSTQQAVNGTAAYWQGEAGTAHRDAYNSHNEEFNTMLARLQEHVTDLNSIAGNYIAFENQIKEIEDALPSDVIVWRGNFQWMKQKFI